MTQQPAHDESVATPSSEDPPADLLDGGPVDETPSYTELDEEPVKDASEADEVN